jgi:hypothetical protein
LACRFDLALMKVNSECARRAQASVSAFIVALFVRIAALRGVIPPQEAAAKQCAGGA